MCSIILRVLFLGSLAGGIVLLGIGMGTTYWRKYNDTDLTHFGLFKVCTYNKACVDLKSPVYGIPAWRKAVIALLSLALLAALFAAGWWLLACIGCCCQRFLTPPLPIFAALIFLLDLSAVITYAAAYQVEGQEKITANGWYGYSFWCTVGSVGAFFLTALLGCGVVGLMGPAGDRNRTAYREI